QLLHPMIDPGADLEVAAKGLNASPGAASGAIVFDADTAVERAAHGPVILVRWETTPDDIHGMIAAQGILTVHGGMTSHAAVVARGMGKPCVAGCEELSLGDGVATIGDHTLREGDVITSYAGSACAPTPTTRRTRSGREGSARKASACAGPSTCSSATGFRSCRR